MLVLSRRPRQKIIVGDTTITVVSLRSGSVRIGIEAPEDVPIWRQEIAPISGPDPNEAPSIASGASIDDSAWARSDDPLIRN